jgi:hypothetical protein
MRNKARTTREHWLTKAQERFAAMQTPEAEAGVRALFAAGPDELG